MQIYKNIAKGFKQETFPTEFESSLVQLIKGLCRKKPEERLPMSSKGVGALQEHPWYTRPKKQWENIQCLKALAPYVPDGQYSFLSSEQVEHPPVAECCGDQDWDADF